jgi:Ca-activated chloride channel family protein
MHGFPLEVSKRLLNNLIGKLRPTDRFNVLLFAGVSNLLSESSLSVNDENINRALQFIDKEQGSGGTELLPALEKALNLKKTEGYARSFIIATDGYVDVEKEAFDLIRNNLNKASFFPFGIGTSVNRYLIEGMAHAGMGQPFVVTGENEALKAAEKFNNYILSPVMTHISVDFDGIDVYDVEPLSIPDVFAERPVIVFGKYRGKPAGSILLKGENAHGTVVMKQAFTANRESASTSALQYLWARERIRTLADYSSVQPEANKDRIVELGLKYNLLTPFTSFLAIDNQIRNNGQSTTVQQPLPLPEGVSDMAVGYATGCVSAPVLKYTAHEARSEAKTITMDEADGDFSEVLPQYYGGDAALQQFISKQLNYPAAAIKAKIGGTVQLLIEIDEHGNVKVINVAKKIGYGCDEEAIRIIKLTSGKWLPGSKNGKSHKMQITIPVEFITSQAK